MLIDFLSHKKRKAIQMTKSTILVNGGAMSEVNSPARSPEIPSISKRDIQMTKVTHSLNRRQFVGGSDARIITGKDEKALLRLWREKRGEVSAPDLSAVLIVQLGLVTEDLNRRWYEQNSGHRIGDVQRHAIHRTIPWMAATLDGLVKETGAVFAAKFTRPGPLSGE